MSYYSHDIKIGEDLNNLSFLYNINKYELLRFNNLQSDDISFLKTIKIPIEYTKNIIENKVTNDALTNEDIIINKIIIIKRRTNIKDEDIIRLALNDSSLDTDKAIAILTKSNISLNNNKIQNEFKGKLKID